jgi:hypothetical protein
MSFKPVTPIRHTTEIKYRVVRQNRPSWATWDNFGRGCLVASLVLATLVIIFR